MRLHPLVHRQHVQLPLHVTPGACGYRIGFREGFGIHFADDQCDVMGAALNFPSWQSVTDAKRAADAALYLLQAYFRSGEKL